MPVALGGCFLDRHCARIGLWHSCLEHNRIHGLAGQDMVAPVVALVRSGLMVSWFYCA